MAHPVETTYDATRDPRTGRPILPIDADNTYKADAESLPLTDEDNQGIDIGDDDAVGEEDDPPHELEADDAEADDAAAPSSVDVNSTIPRMKAAAPETEELESGDEITDDELIDDETVDEETVEGERPEALAKFAEVARNGDGKPVRNGTEATAETAPIPTDPALKQDAATRVLREGVLKQDQGAEEAIDRLPDRTAPRHNLLQGAMMTEKKLPKSPLRPDAPNYGNARGRDASQDNEGIEEENNPGVSPGNVPEPDERVNDAVSEEGDDAQQFQDSNYAQYMNRGDGRYVKPMEDQAEGSFGPDKDHRGVTRRIHRQKSQ